MATRTSVPSGGAGQQPAAPAGGARRTTPSVDLEKMREHDEQLKNEPTMFGDVTYWDPPEAVSYIRLCPPWSDDNVPFRELWYHYRLVKMRNKEGKEKNKALVCPRKTKSVNKPCPICEAADQLFQTGLDADKERGKALNSKRRYFYNIIDRANEAAGVQTFGCGVGIHKAITGHFADPDYGDITDPYEGFDFIIERTGQGLDTDYPQKKARRLPSPMGTPDQMNDWLGNLFDLDALESVESYESLTLALNDPEEWQARKEAEQAAKKAEKDGGGAQQPEAPAQRAVHAGPVNEYPRLEARAQELNIHWTGEATEADLRAWITEEENKIQQAEATHTALAPAPAQRMHVDDAHAIERTRLLEHARALGIDWTGSATDADLRAWIAGEEAKMQQTTPAQRTTAPAQQTPATRTTAPVAPSGGETLAHEIDATLAERQAKRR